MKFLRLSLKVCTFTDPLVPRTKMINLIFHQPPFSPSASPATFSSQTSGRNGFQRATFGVDGSCKDGKMGSVCCEFKGEASEKCARVGRGEEVMKANMQELGGVVLALQSAGLCEDVLLLCDNEAVLCVIKKWVGQG